MTAHTAFHQQTSSYNVRRPYGKHAAHEVDQWSGQQRNAPPYQMTIGLRTHISPHEIVKPWTPVYSQGSTVKPVEQRAAVLTRQRDTRLCKHQVDSGQLTQPALDFPTPPAKNRKTRQSARGEWQRKENGVFVRTTLSYMRRGAGRCRSSAWYRARDTTKTCHAAATYDGRPCDRRIQPRSVSRINLSTGAAAPLHQRRVTTVYTDLRLPPSSHGPTDIRLV